MNRHYTVYLHAINGSTTAFQGTLEQWENCFFTLPQDRGESIEQIMAFCEQQEWAIVITYNRLEK